jgi:hypothetical protein
MPGSATTFLEGAVLGHTLGFAAMTMPATIFIALSMATPPPTAGTGGTEPPGANGYARQAASFAISTPANLAANTTTISFPAATAAWGSIGYFEIWSALTAGNRLYWGPLVDPADGTTPITRTVQAGDIVRLQAGTIQVRAT